jgi:hypothetical protein
VLGGSVDVDELLAKPLVKAHKGADGERNARSKLTKAEVEAILRRHHFGESQCALAKAYGVGTGNLNAIVKGRTWMAVYARVMAELNPETTQTTDPLKK